MIEQAGPNDLANCFWYITQMAKSMPFMQALINELIRLYKKSGERIPDALSRGQPDS